MLDCQRADKAEGGRYQLITKTKARDEYLLTEAQCGALGCIKKPNPHDARYGEMRLYLRAQVAAAALASWGSEEGLLVERERRREERLQRSKRKAAAGGGAAGARHIKRGGRAPGGRAGGGAAAAAAAARRSRAARRRRTSTRSCPTRRTTRTPTSGRSGARAGSKWCTRGVSVR